jgi:methyl-accepting chemotaxis protein
VRRLVVPFAALLLIPAVLTGCGSSDSSPEADWAQSFCDSLGQWKSSVTTAAQSLTDTSNLTQNKARDAVNAISSANNALVDDLKNLGKPEGSAGAQAKADVQQLSDQLKADADKIENTMQGVTSVQGLLGAVSSMAGVASSAANSVSSTITKLKSLNEEWKQAFQNSDACKSLSKS